MTNHTMKGPPVISPMDPLKANWGEEDEAYFKRIDEAERILTHWLESSSTPEQARLNMGDCFLLFKDLEAHTSKARAIIRPSSKERAERLAAFENRIRGYDRVLGERFPGYRETRLRNLPTDLAHFTKGVKAAKFLRFFSDNAKEVIQYNKEGHGPEDLVEQMTKARLFVFDFTPPRPTKEDLANEEELNLPFPICSFETTSDSGFIGQIEGFSIGCLKLLQLLVVEVSPLKYAIYMTGLTTNFAEEPESWRIATGHILSDDEKFPEIRQLACYYVRKYCERLRSGVLATERINERVKIVTKSSGKVLHKIKEIVHVRAKKVTGATGIYGGPIDYTHRWEVMGHFRKLDKETKVGKDRAGQYVVTGVTWVVPHTKGPENKPLVKKTRVVSGS